MNSAENLFRREAIVGRQQRFLGEAHSPTIYSSDGYVLLAIVILVAMLLALASMTYQPRWRMSCITTEIHSRSSTPLSLSCKVQGEQHPFQSSNKDFEAELQGQFGPSSYSLKGHVRGGDLSSSSIGHDLALSFYFGEPPFYPVLRDNSLLLTISGPEKSVLSSLSIHRD